MIAESIVVRLDTAPALAECTGRSEPFPFTYQFMSAESDDAELHYVALPTLRMSILLLLQHAVALGWYTFHVTYNCFRVAQRGRFMTAAVTFYGGVDWRRGCAMTVQQLSDEWFPPRATTVNKYDTFIYTISQCDRPCTADHPTKCAH